MIFPQLVSGTFWLLTETQFHSVQITSTPGLYLGPGIYAETAFCSKFYTVTIVVIIVRV